MFTHKLLVPAAIALVAATAAPAGFADGGHGRGPGPFGLFMGAPPDLDANGDGKVTKDELNAARGAEFKKIDANGDGSVILAELQAWTAQKLEDRFDSLDADGSDAISSEEFVTGRKGRALAMARNVFKLADTDGDGSLSAAEFTVMAGKAGNPEMYFAAMDADSDGKVSESEYAELPPRPDRQGHRRPDGPKED